MNTGEGKVVYCFLPLRDDQKKRLEEAAPKAEFVYAKRKDITKEELYRANVVIGNCGCENIAGSPNIEFVQTQSAGCEHYVQPGILRDECILANGTGTFGPGISEYMLAITLEHCRGLHIYRDNQIARKWSWDTHAVELYRSTVIVLGIGDIGSEYAKKIKACGSYVIGFSKHRKETKPDYFDELHTIDELDEHIGRADIIACIMPETPETINLINKSRFEKMKKGVILINAGRGSAINTDDLCEALDKKILGGVGLDVVNPEPLPEDHKLWSYREVTITPHNTGGSLYKEGGSAFEDRNFDLVVLENFKKFINGEKIQAVDRKTGYRQSSEPKK